MSGCECFVDQQSVFGHGAYDILQNWTPKIVGDDHASENAVGQRKTGPGFEVGGYQFHVVTVRQIPDGREIAVDGGDAVASI